MSGILAGKVCVITGAASGIGRGIAMAAHAHGAKAIILADITEGPREGGASTLELLEAEGAVARFVRCDVTSADDMVALVKAADEFGGVDAMVCNAGIALAADGLDVSSDDFHKVMAINVEGVLLSAQAAARAMQERGLGGSIIVTSSMGGLRGAGFTVAYSMSKGAVNMMVRSLSDAVGPAGIRVNAVCPGLIQTALVESSPEVAKAFEPMRLRMPLRRLGQPREVGDAVAWLASDLSSFVTGVLLPVDGGQTAVI